MMSILAESCAGKVKKTVTDEDQALGALGRYLAAANQGTYGKKLQKSSDILAVVPFRSLNIGAIPIRNLIRLRKKERNEAGGGMYRELRHNLLKRTETHIATISTQPNTTGQLLDITRQFDDELLRDYQDLARELGVTAREVFGAKEMAAIVPLSAATAAFVGPFLGGCVALAGLAKTSGKYHSARRQILRGHVTSYIYLAQKGRFEWDLR
jgi:hypothetical protein